ncbi:PIN domain-containing protein [Crocosphaera sp.]|uniref:type II toxin-antitoxin system VapC family toxin n=1 Tax=Crocosphaera sp. TaxID=2729996 RepID=UPI00261C1888|nr:PIN domain-containing protein [Crocosphaera sp.]MDJ0579835.1 PIN domain-containing protein [Crocosphaera sp.]
MIYLVDTNIILRLRQINNPMNSDPVNAVQTLKKRSEKLCIVPQNLVEFWVVATRPIKVNGLGLSFEEAIIEIEDIKQIFDLYQDTSGLYTEWERLIKKYQVIGKQAHDTRLVAAMITHKIDYILTFNTDDFLRYSEITPIDPRTIQ